jgi:hypothetical protein
MDQYVELSGGLDLETPPVTAGAGTALLVENVYESVKGGYTTIAGYERFDGQDKPSNEAYYHTVWELLALGGGMSLALDSVVGDAVTIDGNVGEILYSIDNAVDEIAVLFKGDGTGAPLIADYPITITTTGGSTYNLVHMIAQGGPTQSYETQTRDEYILVPQNIQRAKILQPAGDSIVKGVHLLTNGDVLAFRDNGADSQCFRQYTNTPGWNLAEEAEIYSVTVATAARAVVGDTFHTGAQVVMGVFDLVVDGVPTNVATQAMYVVKNTAAALTGGAPLVTDVGALNRGAIIALYPWTFLAAGTMSLINFNFYAGLTTDRAYFADGINPPMYYDPIQHVVVPIFTSYNEQNDVAAHVAEFQGRLLATTTYGGFITSVTGTPDLIDGTLGSIEVGVGGIITAFSKVSANLLAVFTNRQTWGLEGTTVATWQFRLLTDSSGAKPYTVTKLDQVFAGDDVGIVQISRTDTLGGMQSSTITNNMQELYADLAKGISCSTSLRAKEQMRYFFDKEAVVASRIAYQSANGNDTVRYGMSTLKLDHTVLCVTTGEDFYGVERTYFGSNDGYVYEMDIGTTFDGQSIDSTVKLAYNHNGGTAVKKRYEGITVEARANSPTTVQVWHSLNDGNKTYNSRDLYYQNGGTSLYNKALYGVALFNAERLGRVKAKLKGTGYNIQIIFNRDSTTEEQVTLTGYSMRYTPRGKVTL